MNKQVRLHLADPNFTHCVKCGIIFPMIGSPLVLDAFFDVNIVVSNPESYKIESDPDVDDGKEVVLCIDEYRVENKDSLGKILADFYRYNKNLSKGIRRMGPSRSTSFDFLTPEGEKQVRHLIGIL